MVSLSVEMAQRLSDLVTWPFLRMSDLNMADLHSLRMTKKAAGEVVEHTCDKEMFCVCKNEFRI